MIESDLYFYKFSIREWIRAVASLVMLVLRFGTLKSYPRCWGALDVCSESNSLLLKVMWNQLTLLICELPAIYVINGKKFCDTQKGEENHEKLI